MVQEQDQSPDADLTANDTGAPSLRRARGRTALFVGAGVLTVALGLTWAMRKDIADNVIARQLDSLGLHARYTIVSVGPSEQVVRDLVIGDPAKPDITIKELRVATRLDWGMPGIGRITVVKPRLYGDMHGGKLTLGSLDKALFKGKGGPFEMPDLDLAVVDGRALIESDYGRLGARLQGKGRLRGGFSGELAAIMPTLSINGCKTGQVTLYGKVTTAAQKPRFEGPVRLRDLVCPAQSLALARAGLQAKVTFDKGLDGAEGKFGLSADRGRYGGNALQGASGTGGFTYRKHALNARYRVAARGVVTPQARFAALSFDGRARSAEGLGRFDVEGDFDGNGIALGSLPDRMLLQTERAGTGTLLAPIAAQVRAGLARETRNSTLAVNLILRRSPEGMSMVVPHGALKGGSGVSLLTLSRVQAMFPATGRPHVTGNFVTGGRQLPQVSGRMESYGGALAMHVDMPEYSAGNARIALPRLALAVSADGTLAFSGQTAVTGDLPGGRAENLVLPIDGRWAANGDLSLWQTCTQVTFDRLTFASLTVDRHRLKLCPAGGGAVVTGQGAEWRIAAGVPTLDLAGHLGQTPIRIASGPISFARAGSRPGAIKAQALKIDLGPVANASHFSISDLQASVGKDIAGTFDRADMGLYAVPLDLRNMAGRWRYSNGMLAIDGARFTLVDRQKDARFKPLIARDAVLHLANDVVTAQAVLREPMSDREVVREEIVHNLATAAGHADLTVKGVRFDQKLQADTLSPLALGVVSNLEGTVRGTGRIDWNPKGVTSHGRFATDGLAFAAPFGPVKGLVGEVALTDLLGLVTAPDQTLRIASINPGIEVTDGIVSFEMKPDHLLQINGAHWPFMGGTLALEPARMKIGIAETRHYTLKVNGLYASALVQHLQLENLSASGVFDGELPLIFDENGGRIEAGRLVSRPPGGSVAYVGELSYKDLSAMGNFAFEALKSMNYQRMEISLDGTLAGEIITRVSFNGISQGAGAKRNFLTKQVAKLPIHFIVNVKAPFFSLFAPLRSLYDPTYVTDPRTLGLIGTDGRPLPNRGAEPVSPEPTIQPPVSEKNP
ncbi:YdbH domain-containing protein [Novosphingobium sp.]|uniref:YdbH domain-containing protein n=1 Tax=Novosphingobium sp. TaxID=1874826 RepID=UPI002FDB8257